MPALGTPAPDFSLQDVVSGRIVSLGAFKAAPVLLVMFICRHCPFVKHVARQLAALGAEYGQRSVAVIAISSNDAVEYPNDGPDSLKEMAIELGFTFPFGYDESQDVAKAYTAACTPDFFVFDGEQRLAYRGQLDDSRPGNGKAV